MNNTTSENNTAGMSDKLLTHLLTVSLPLGRYVQIRDEAMKRGLI
jgi:hypothetical protein